MTTIANPFRFGLVAAAAVVAVSACAGETETQTDTSPPPTTAVATSPATTSAPTTVPEEEPTTVTYNPQGLEPLAGGFHYEGWVIVSGQPIPAGKFNVDESGGVVSIDGDPMATFEVPEEATAATDIVLTIEPPGDTDATPSATKIAGGPVEDSSSTLTVAHPAALGDDFSSAAATYILATPTNGDGSNERSGIWWVHFQPRRPSLVLPELPEGWQYEGWVVIDGTPVTTGRFLVADEADFAAPFSGPEAGPPFPGEDFIVNAPVGLEFPTDLSGMVAVVSIEPEPDDGPAPFVLKPLVGQIPDPASDHTNYDMANQAADFPTLMATISG